MASLSEIRSNSRLARVEEVGAERGEVTEGVVQSRAPHLVLRGGVTVQRERVPGPVREPAHLLNVVVQRTVAQPGRAVEKLVQEVADLRDLVGAHGDLSEPQNLLLTPVRPGEVVSEDLLVVLDLGGHGLGVPGVGVDLNDVEHIPAVSRLAGEVSARLGQREVLEGSKPARAVLERSVLRGVHANACAPVTRCPHRHRRRHDLARLAWLVGGELVDYRLPVTSRGLGVEQGLPARRGRTTPLPQGARVRRGVPVTVTGGAVHVGLVETHDVRSVDQEGQIVRGGLPPDHRHKALVEGLLLRLAEGTLIDLRLGAPVPPEIHVTGLQQTLEALRAAPEVARRRTAFQIRSQGCGWNEERKHRSFRYYLGRVTIKYRN
eukprot:Hpha_TRINITY_DN16232_c3_g4::TRINITY_DN16232_c3_g4_i1::g.14416::m.14416